MEHIKKISYFFGAAVLMLLLSGCDIAVLQPVGYVSKEMRNLIVVSFVLMLLIVIPVMIAVVVFAFKYRASNKNAEYLPDWGGSHKLEFWMWIIPICMVSILAVLSATYIHKLEPSKVLPESVAGNEPILQIDAVALDWKWLFIYPQYGVATVNEIYAPAGRQVLIQMTAENSVNAFWVPKLGPVLYAMPQMNDKLHLISKEDGVYKGRSANYSGAGFAGMEFDWHSVSRGDFNAWVAKARQSRNRLDRAAYLNLAQASQGNPVAYYSGVEKDLYYRVVNRCVVSGTVCNEELMKIAAAKSLWGQLCSVFDPGVVAVK
ncbi:MAG: ubiquinol oxidase subunit II [Candidatus Tokpelaia sp.]|uniref:ubiquinol oxidase subunit II n=1 Tax=Candidatus Tokpelaia sp. TaxID=2233777 RepID=UPI00123A71F9|nr:ubiquinol oxidase subunit II [Candidatus Tokpelaia sp.]KAA6204939.1 MAG: ubiquinol oxidase subunit II [Candidatus Tokpelaia sp.]KAA6207080.1 MAG: ubiquinol oxidase subunit II [Candidatus Tokpelaia sp.]KAA6405379.1 ubiquinol oxidase subunit II [Candidatus Tokpelaia sp.]